MKLARKTTSIKEAADILAANQSIALFSHVNPDGDTLGASVALYLSLKKAGKNVAIFCDGELGDKMSSFEAMNNVSHEFFGKYDLYVAVDSGDVFRLGNFAGIYGGVDETLTIDHHGGEYYSKYNCIYKYASTCQIVYEILSEMRLLIDAETATYLYMGLCTDTCNFSHSNTDSSCFDTASALLKLGADSQRIIRVLLKDLTLSELRFRAKVVSRLRTYYNDKLAVLYITKADLDEFGLDQTATTGVVQYAIDIDTSIAGVCISEYSPHTYKVSMRGKNFSVRKICEEFGGGGHEFASGCMISGFLEDVIEKIVRTVGFYI